MAASELSSSQLSLLTQAYAGTSIASVAELLCGEVVVGRIATLLEEIETIAEAALQSNPHVVSETLSNESSSTLIQTVSTQQSLLREALNPNVLRASGAQSPKAVLAAAIRVTGTLDPEPLDKAQRP